MWLPLLQQGGAQSLSHRCPKIRCLVHNAARLVLVPPSDQRLSNGGERRPGSPLEINVCERLTVGVADDEAGVGLLDGLGRREAALMVGQGGNAA